MQSFRQWYESIFSQPADSADGEEPASNIPAGPHGLNKGAMGTMPEPGGYLLDDRGKLLPGQNKKKFSKVAFLNALAPSQEKMK
jgi:hypothetical protein